MTRESIQERKAEINDQNDRMAGLIVAVICSGLMLSIGLLIGASL